MHVLIDLHWLRPGRTGGSETVARCFLRTLPQTNAPHRYTVCVPTEVRYDPDLPIGPTVRLVTVDGPAQVLRRLLGRPRFRDLQADVGLSLTGYIHPDLMTRPYVLVVLDIQHEYHPEFFSLAELIERQYLFTKSIRHAAHVCAVSEFTRQTLLERYDLPPQGVTTVYPAADPIFEPTSPYRGRTAGVLGKYGLTAGTYLFYPAHTWPHKNHVLLLRALRLLRDRYGDDPLLVCTGRPKAAHEDFLHAVRELRLEDRLRWLGYVPARDMPALYEGALALVYPSLFEGFGMPLLEAMACACPVVCSDATSLPEIAADAALTVDPRDPEAWAEAIHRVLTDPTLRAALIRRGRRRASRFSWRQFTATLLDVLERVAPLPPQDPGTSDPSPAPKAPEGRRRWARPGIPGGTTVARTLATLLYPRLRQWGRGMYSWCARALDRWSGVPAPTRRLMDHPEPWWDGWAGPRLVLHPTTDRPVQTLSVRGWRPPQGGTSPLVLTAFLDGIPVAQTSISRTGPFEWQTPLPRPLPPGPHVLEIRAHPWWIPHRWTRNGDYRPLTWHVREVRLI